MSSHNPKPKRSLDKRRELKAKKRAAKRITGQPSGNAHDRRIQRRAK